MIKGTVPTSQQTSHSTYSIHQAINLLSLALRYMPIQKENAFEEMYDENLSQYFYKEIVCALNVNMNTFEEIKDSFEEKIRHFNANSSSGMLWERWIKEIFLNCHLLDQKNIKVSDSVKLFFDELIEVFNVKDRGRIPAERIIQSFAKFIQQLRIIDAQDTAKALHNFIFFTRHIAIVKASGDENAPDREHQYLTELLSPTLLSILQLKGKLYFKQYDHHEGQKLSIRDHLIVKIIAEAILNSDFFDKSFDYSNYPKPNVLLCSLSNVVDKISMSDTESPSLPHLQPALPNTSPAILYSPAITQKTSLLQKITTIKLPFLSPAKVTR
ncbi:MAG: hypothetical protein J0H47_11295 [Gammaproteobacteria bacterium]|nr:hypothetical protein [Gammaproteobacteria bacterium]